MSRECIELCRENNQLIVTTKGNKGFLSHNLLEIALNNKNKALKSPSEFELGLFSPLNFHCLYSKASSPSRKCNR